MKKYIKSSLMLDRKNNGKGYITKYLPEDVLIEFEHYVDTLISKVSSLVPEECKLIYYYSIFEREEKRIDSLEEYTAQFWIDTLNKRGTQNGDSTMMFAYLIVHDDGGDGEIDIKPSSKYGFPLDYQGIRKAIEIQIENYYKYINKDNRKTARGPRW